MTQEQVETEAKTINQDAVMASELIEEILKGNQEGYMFEMLASHTVSAIARDDAETLAAIADQSHRAMSPAFGLSPETHARFLSYIEITHTALSYHIPEVTPEEYTWLQLAADGIFSYHKPEGEGLSEPEIGLLRKHLIVTRSINGHLYVEASPKGMARLKLDAHQVEQWPEY